MQTKVTESWILEERTNEFGLSESRWGPGEYDWMVQIPSGKFMMGALPKDTENQNDEKPCHEVIFKEPFWLMKYPVTQNQYNMVMNMNPSNFSGDGNRPVEKVSWKDAMIFINRAQEKYGTLFRLPSEAEWEYACRGKTQNVYYWGDEIDLNYVWLKHNSGGKTQPVGQKKPNGYGLYDMLGNVWEWIQDNYHNNYRTAPKNGYICKKKLFSHCRVVRGGAWICLDKFLRVSNRHHFHSKVRNCALGFRCASNI